MLMLSRQNKHLLVTTLLSSCLIQTAAVAGERYIPQLPPLAAQAASGALYEARSALDLSVGGSMEMEYQDNINRERSNGSDDFVAIFSPDFTLRSDFKPYEFVLRGGLEVGQYLSEDENNYVDADLRSKLAYDINSFVNAYVDGRYRYDHVAIGAFDDDQDKADAPTTYRYFEAGAGLDVDADLWLGKYDLRVQHYNYDNVRRLDGTPLINDDRDRTEVSMLGRVGHRFWNDTALYVQGELNQRSYQKHVDSTASLTRNSDGAEILTGIQWGMDDRTFSGDIAIGYLSQNYKEASMPDVDTIAFRGEMRWRPDAEWDLRAGFGNHVMESTSTATSSYLQSRLFATLSHHCTEDWTVGAKTRFTRNDFQVDPLSGRASRIDDIWEAGVFAEYQFVEGYAVTFDVSHQDRDSDDARANYKANVASLGLKILY